MAKKSKRIHGIAHALSFQTEEDSVYGVLDGLWFSVNQDDNRSILRMETAVYLNEKQKTKWKDALATLSKKERFSFHMKDHRLTLLVFAGISRGKTVEKVRSVLEEIADGLTFLNATPVCHRCAARGLHPFHMNGDTAVMLCPACSDAISSEYDGERQKLEVKGSYGRGFLGAFLGALLGAALWVAMAYFGWPAAVSGIAVGYFAIKGYKRANGRVGPKMPRNIVLASLLGLLLAVVVEIALIISLSAELDVGFFQALSLALFILLDLRTFYWLSVFTGFLFAGIGSTVSFRKVRKEARYLPYRLKKL